MNLVVGYRSMAMGNYRDVIRFTKMDMCAQDVSKLSINNAFRKEFERFNRQLGYPMKPCPWKTFEITNATFSYKENTTYDEVNKSPRLMPNGEYRIHAKLFNDRDENIITARFIVTLKIFTNEEPM